MLYPDILAVVARRGLKVRNCAFLHSGAGTQRLKALGHTLQVEGMQLLSIYKLTEVHYFYKCDTENQK